MNFYTYIHRRADDGRVFYVGKGKGRRAWSANKRNQHWRNVVAKHGHTVEVLAHWVTEAESFEHERFLIACFRDLGAPLVNKTDGGEGTSGWVPSPETRAKIGAAGKGRRHSADARAKIGAASVARASHAKLLAANVGRAPSEETKAKISAAQKGRVVPEEQRAKMRAAGKRRAPPSEETRAKLSSAGKGRKVSARTRAKISATKMHAARSRREEDEKWFR